MELGARAGEDGSEEVMLLPSREGRCGVERRPREQCMRARAEENRCCSESNLNPSGLRCRQEKVSDVDSRVCRQFTRCQRRQLEQLLLHSSLKPSIGHCRQGQSVAQVCTG